MHDQQNGPKNCIAYEFNEMHRTGKCEGGGDEKAEDVDLTDCFDLAAARGIRGERGKCAAHVAAEHKDRQTVPDLPTDATWKQAEEILSKSFPFLRSAAMRADSHTPPADWDYKTGPWKCKRPGCNVLFASHADWKASVHKVQSPRSDKSEEGKKAATKRAESFSRLHPQGQAEHEPPILDIDMDKVIIDPLHCLFLNLPKTLWKHCFGDRMTNGQREEVAQYLSEIGCSLDIRAKGDGRDADRKWFAGAILQRFVEGGSDESVGGLIQNIQKIVDIIFRTTTTAPDPDPDPDPAPTPAPAPAKPKKAPRAGSKKRVGGFSAVEEAEAEMAPATGIPATTSSTPPPPDDEETASLRARYGSDMDLVKLIFAAWKQFGLLYANGKEEWPTVVDETVKEARALSVLRCAIAFSEAMTNVSYKKHMISHGMCS